MKRTTRIVAVAVAAVAVANTVNAVPIGLGAFSGSETVINFDNLVGGSTLGSGEVITSQYAGQGVQFGNAQATANNFISALMPSASLPNVVFVYQGGGAPPGSFAPLSISFSVPVARVGLDFGLSVDSFLTMAAYDSANNLLESVNFVGLPTGGVLVGFAGLQQNINIARVDLSYHPNVNPTATFNFVLDNLRFESAGVNQVPDSGNSLGLLAIALVGLLGYRFARGRDCPSVLIPPTPANTRSGAKRKAGYAASVRIAQPARHNPKAN